VKPLAIFINLVGPIANPEHGMTHQCEIGIVRKDSKKPDVSSVILKTDSTAKAIELACEAVKLFVIEKYPKQAGNGSPPENLINLNG
jgi:hypothetical protein